MRSNACILLLATILFFTSVSGQPKAPILNFRHITEKDGLSHNIVNSLTKDREGYMWIGTYDGLCRFDGTHFTVYRNDRRLTNSLSNNTVHGVCVDSSGNIWCATQTGVSCFDKKTRSFRNYFTDMTSESSVFNDILCDRNGTIWCSGSRGIFEFVPDRNSFRPFFPQGARKENLSSNAIHKRGLILSPDKNSLWIATTKGINQVDLSTRNVFNYRNNPRGLRVFDSLEHYPLCFDRTGKLLFGRVQPDRLVQFDPVANSITELDILLSSKYHATGPPACIYADRNNSYWISDWHYTSFLYEPSLGKVTEFVYDRDNPFSVSGDFFWDVYEDEEGTVWLGTVNGLSCYNARQSIHRLYNPLKGANFGDPVNVINRFMEDRDGTWWFTSFDNAKLYQFNPQSGSLLDHPLNIPGFFCRGILRYKDFLILASTSGIHVFNTRSGHIESSPELATLQAAAGNKEINWMIMREDSVICLMSQPDGLIEFDPAHRTVRRYPAGESGFLRRNMAYSRNAVVSQDGSLLIGLGGLKVGRYRPGENGLDSLPLQPEPSIKILQGQTMGLREAKDGTLWIALKEAGLVRYDPATGISRIWQQTEGLSLNLIYELEIDRAGRIWTAAYNKFSVFDPMRSSFDNFSIPVSEDNVGYVNKMLVLRNGNILSNVGPYFIEWMPDKLGLNTPAAPVLINRVVVKDSSIWPQNGTLKLEHTQDNFSIEFGLLTALDKNRYRLQYKLEGVDERWRDAGSQDIAEYTNVPERSFVFRVRAVSANGQWQGKETRLTIRVIPPFYRTVAFRFAAALLIATIALLLIRMRINLIRRAEKEKSEFSRMLNEWRLKALRGQMNPHFIFNCMNSIDYYILKNDGENASRYLNKFAKLVRLILEQSNDMYTPLEKELEMLRYYIELEALRFDRPFSYTIECSRDIDPEYTEIPSMLLQPFVENAIIHGLRHKKEAGELKVILSRSGNGLFCIIEDNGVGRKESARINANRPGRHESRGTLLTEERLKVMEKDHDKPEIRILDLADESGQALGTRVEITIPMEFDH